MVTGNKKYRPSLTAAQVEHILKLAKTESPHISDESIRLIGVLSPFKAKIDNAALTPAYETTGRQSLLESLGETDPVTLQNTLAQEGHLTKEEYWEKCFYKYLSDPTSCSLEEIKARNEWRYLEGLMTPEEAAAFES